MDKLYRSLVLDNNVAATGIDLENALQEAVDRLGLSDAAAVAAGRTLLMTAFLASITKSDTERYTVIIDGNGGFGQILGRGDKGGSIRCAIEHPDFVCDLDKYSRQSIREGVGVEGTLTVIHDLGLKEPYIGKTPLVNGEIADDFAYYFTFSQQTPSAIALGVRVENGKVQKCMGIVTQLLPSCPDQIITMLEDIVSEFGHLERSEYTAKRLLEEYFGHLGIEWLDEVEPKYDCDCNKDKMDALIKGLGRAEAMDIVQSEGKIEVVCEFCNRRYRYLASDIERLFDGK